LRINGLINVKSHRKSDKTDEEKVKNVKNSREKKENHSVANKSLSPGRDATFLEIHKICIHHFQELSSNYVRTWPMIADPEVVTANGSNKVATDIGLDGRLEVSCTSSSAVRQQSTKS
jgi:hypothetical protein